MLLLFATTTFGTIQVWAEQSRTVVVLGDSISAAYGMNLEEGWVALLNRHLETRELDYEVVNASISGDTSGGGLRRLPALLEQHQPAVLVVELGGNDGLRGYPIGQLRDNLAQIAQSAMAAGARVLLLAMEIPPNLGPRYSALFRDSYQIVAEQTGAQASAFMLDGIATEPSLMQDDGIHPTAAAQARILDNVWTYLEPLLEPSP